MSVQDALGFFYLLRFGAGAVFVIGALIFIYALLVPRKQSVTMAAAPAE